MLNKIEEPLTVAEVCSMLRIHKTTVYDLIHAGELKAYGVGLKRAGIRIDKSEVDRYKREGQIKQ